MRLHRILLLSLLGCLYCATCVLTHDCDLADDVLFCERSQTLPLPIDDDVMTIVIDDALRPTYMDILKRLDPKIQVVVWGQKHCARICKDSTMRRWTHQCKCKVSTPKQVLHFNG